MCILVSSLHLHHSTACEAVSDKDVTAEIVDLAIVSNFIPKMAHQWDSIGYLLNETDLVMDLRRAPINYGARRKCAQILEAAVTSQSPPNYRTFFSILRSPGVDLPEVASELQQAVVRKHQFQREPEQLQAASD